MNDNISLSKTDMRDIGILFAAAGLEVPKFNKVGDGHFDVMHSQGTYGTLLKSEDSMWAAEVFEFALDDPDNLYPIAKLAGESSDPVLAGLEIMKAWVGQKALDALTALALDE